MHKLRKRLCFYDQHFPNTIFLRGNDPPQTWICDSSMLGERKQLPNAGEKCVLPWYKVKNHQKKNKKSKKMLPIEFSGHKKNRFLHQRR